MPMPPPPIVFLPHSNELNVYTVPTRPPFIIGDAGCFYPVLQIPQTPFVVQFGQPFVPFSRGDQPTTHPQMQSTFVHSQPPQFATTMNNETPPPPPKSVSHPFCTKSIDFANEVAPRGSLPSASPVCPKKYAGPARNDEKTKWQLDRGIARKNFGQPSNAPVRPLLEVEVSVSSRGWQWTLGQRPAIQVPPTEVWQSHYSKKLQNFPSPPGPQTKNDQTSTTSGLKNAPQNLKFLHESVNEKPPETSSQKLTAKLSSVDKVIEDKDTSKPFKGVPEKTDLEKKNEEGEWLTASSPKKIIRNRQKREDPEELFYKRYDRSVITLHPIIEEQDSRHTLRGTSKSFRVHSISGKPSCSSTTLTEADRSSMEKLACDLKSRLTLAPPKTVPSSSTPHISIQNWSYAAIASAARLAAKPKPIPPNSDITGVSVEPAFIIAKRGQSLPVPPSPRTPQKRQKKVKKPSQAQIKKLREEELKLLASRFRQALAVAVETMPARRRKEREKPKPKRLTKLKRGVLNDRLARRNAAAKTAASLPYRRVNVHEELPIAGDEAGSPRSLECQPCHVETSDRPASQTTESSKTLTTDLVYADLDGQKLPEPSTSLSVTTTRNIAPPSFPELETLIEQILTLLVDFHDRAYKSNESNAAKKKKSRRIVCGLREVIKHLKLNHMKFIVVAKDLEKGAYEIDDRPALEDPEVDNVVREDATPCRTNALAKVLKQIIDLANERQCPVILAFKRHQLRRFCRKTSAVSVVGIINVDGAEDKAKQLLEQWKHHATQTALTG